MAYNIIFYFSDQQRWDTCGCFGQPLNITPNLDKLAAEGVKFDNAFSPQPVCGPCRALMVSRGSYSIFVSSPFCIAFLALTALVIGSVAFNKMKARKKKNG